MGTREICHITCVILFKSFESSSIIHKTVIFKLGSFDSLRVLGAASGPDLLYVCVFLLKGCFSALPILFNLHLEQF